MTWQMHISTALIINKPRGISTLGEVHHVAIWGVTQQLLCSKSHDFLAIFTLAHSKFNQIAQFVDEIIQEVSD